MPLLFETCTSTWVDVMRVSSWVIFRGWVSLVNVYLYGGPVDGTLGD